MSDASVAPTSGSLAEHAKDAGVTGAVGGRPIHAHLTGRLDCIIANGVECLPLSAADRHVMVHRALEVVRGLHRVCDATGAREGIIAISERYDDAADAIAFVLRRFSGIRLVRVGDFYPAGEASVLAAELLSIPPAPASALREAGVGVLNVRTLADLDAAARGRALTHRDVTVTGAVRAPQVVRAPIGTTIATLVACAGGVTTPDPVFFAGDPLTGRPSPHAHTAVDKRTGTVVVLPGDHPAARTATAGADETLARLEAGCTRCGACGAVCPSRGIGLALNPDRIVGALVAGHAPPEEILAGAALCMDCRLCEIFACPTRVSPAAALREARAHLPASASRLPVGAPPPNWLAGNRVPRERVIARMGLDRYDRPVRAATVIPRPAHLYLPLAGASPMVSRGTWVAAGELLATGPTAASLHAPQAGTITAVSPTHVVLSAQPPR